LTALAVLIAVALATAGCGQDHRSAAPRPAAAGATGAHGAAAARAGARPAPHGRTALVRALRRELRSAGPGSVAFVYDITARRPLLALRADTPRAPASVEKLYTSVALLRRIGRDAHLTTTVLGTGSLGRHGIWHGDLYLRGGGDPSLGSARFNAIYEQGRGSTLAPLVSQLRADGVRRVEGSLYGDESSFDRRRGGPASAYAADLPDLGGELGALTFDHGSTLALVNRHGPRYALTPAVDAGVELARALRGSGVAVRAATGSRSAPNGAHELARVQSPNVLTLIGLTDLPSDDFYAEMLTKQLGLRFAGEGSTAAGARVIASTIAAYGIRPRVADGSGLSRANHTTARQLVTLLTAIAGTPLGSQLAGVLPVAGESGTLAREMRGTAAQGRCQAKTGTLTYVTSLAGYCRSHGGHTLAFALIIDGLADSRARAIRDAMARAMARDDPALP
jgi:D-alanyl-D-alanine carboxypeptidase/D-alanyl-D-alanine-endopeptidase (penicillin-binding protein 4)